LEFNFQQELLLSADFLTIVSSHSRQTSTTFQIAAQKNRS
jgi:hypothetical protein